MKKKILISKQDYEKLKEHLFQSHGGEEAAFLICGTAETPDSINFLIREIVPVPKNGFRHKGQAGLIIDPDFIMPLLKRCKYENLSIILAHSHPFSDAHVDFSFIDDDGENILMPKIQERIPDRHHGTLVMGVNSINARFWRKNTKQSEDIDSIRIVGRPIKEINIIKENIPGTINSKEIYNRQILALGEYGQKIIQNSYVGIVGLGGIGSHVFQQIIHLGVSKVLVIDPDTVEESNLSRLIGSKSDDALDKKLKVSVMERFANEIRPDTRVIAEKGTIYDISIAQKLLDTDIIFCCTDNLTSRMILNRISYQYFIPVIDTGVDIQCTSIGNIRSAAGRITVLLPDEPCLGCIGILEPERLAKEADELLLGKEPRNEYISGISTFAPAVVSLNGVVASLAVTEFIDLLTGLEKQRDPKMYQMYRVLGGDVRLYSKENLTGDKICLDVKGMGDGLDLPCRLNR
jgi:molybdopterin/thiamine biosynthesis adenylyltransferase